jgi:TldD protein
MQDIEIALDVLEGAGAGYGDLRFVRLQSEFVEIKDGVVGEIQRKFSSGVGVRVLIDGAWGFASTSEPSRKRIQKVAEEAISHARASKLVLKNPAKLVPEERHVAEWRTPYRIDPFKVSLEEKLKILFEIDKVLRSVKKIATARAFFHFIKKEQIFLSLEGSRIKQEILWSGAGYSATAISGDETQIRSYPCSFGDYSCAGYEFIEGLRLLENAGQIAEEAVALLSAPRCPQGEKDLILGSSQLALQIHESCGHPSELDRVLGMEANFAGTSFLTLDKVGKLKYGSKIVNIYADSTLAGGLGSFGYDDEGVSAKRVDLVRDGIFVGYLSSRETATLARLERSSGAARADSYNHIPLIRMTNVNLEPCEGSLEELIAQTKEGVLMDVNKSWSIDQQRLNFQFGCEIGWEIKDGKKVRMVKNPTYQGITPQFWNACDAICGMEEWRLWGVISCGKGEPLQLMGVGHGVAPARFKGIKLGVGYEK